MLERYSDQARRVVARATDEADRLGHPHIGTEHLLLGLLAEEGSATARSLPPGTTVAIARRKVAEAVGTNGSVTLAGGRSFGADPSGAPGPSPGERPFTPRARRALDRAARFSLQRREPAVDATHVLLGVLDVEGTAGQVLRGLGVDVGRLHEAADRATAPDAPPTAEPADVRVVPEPVEATPATPPAPAGSSAGPLGAPPGRPPICACGAMVEMALSYRAVSGRDQVGQRRPFVVAFCSACGAVLGASPE